MWVPFAIHRPVSLRSSQRRIVPQGVVLHTAVTNSQYLKPTGTVRWTFYNNERGQLYQFFRTDVAAPCQLDGNYWIVNGEPRGFLSVEHWDGAYSHEWPNPPSNWSGGPAYTDDQLETDAKLVRWLHEEYGIPLDDPSHARGRGIGHHNMFTNTSPHEWNSSHACPGSRRAGQTDDIIDLAKRLDERDWFDMADKKDLREVVDAALDAKLGPAVRNGIDDMRQPIAGRVLNTNFPTGVEHLDKQGGRNIPWFLRDLRNKTYATAEAVEKLAKAEIERAAVGSAEREDLLAAVAALRAALDEEPTDGGTVPEDEETES